MARNIKSGAYTYKLCMEYHCKLNIIKYFDGVKLWIYVQSGNLEISTSCIINIYKEMSQRDPITCKKFCNRADTYICEK